MILCWTMFVIAMCLMARASDLTVFCPKVEDTILPEKHLWDKDGYPKWIELGMR
jgi:hypothetical protein